MIKENFEKYIVGLQNKITLKLEEIDRVAKFREDNWTRPGGGGGKTKVMENGKVFEKAGVNTSSVYGSLPEPMQKLFQVEEAKFSACGLSLVIHPQNPMVPTVHANWRYFELYDAQNKKIDAWFGGGQDLTPYYLFEEDAKHFHRVYKKVCDKYDPMFYSEFKKACDEYFWNTHRNEARGVGGLFFDYLKESEKTSLEQWHRFVTETGNKFLESYIPIVEKRKNHPYTEHNRKWQEIRRGRYVEFNLIHDRGTLFGFKTKGRIESILMSLPPHAQWIYDYHPAPESAEENLLKVLQTPVAWVED
ncbi:MAG TPA: oxygen-dependent coproporphyrinogen oxidase [Sphingobacterium sp.]|nr:oxygen-dependent coproporphyrinogen oxidase [Sphingobacterium sp.]